MNQINMTQIHSSVAYQPVIGIPNDIQILYLTYKDRINTKPRFWTIIRIVILKWKCFSYSYNTSYT